MNSMNNWIEHLHHPLVFAGFGVFLLALLLRPLFLNNKKLTGTATERLLSKGMILVFILALLAIIGGVALSWKRGEQSTASATKTQPVVQKNSNGRTTDIIDKYWYIETGEHQASVVFVADAANGFTGTYSAIKDQGMLPL